MIALFLQSLAITLTLELLTALIFLHALKITKKVLWFVLIANLITLPTIWFLFTLMIRDYNSVIIFGELFAFIFEAYFIFLFAKKNISLKQSFLLSLIMNLISFFIGERIFCLIG